MSDRYTPVTPADATILLVDHQPGVMAMVKSVDAEVLAANVGLLARLGEQTDIPLVVTSTREELAFLGTSIEAIQKGAPKAFAGRIRRAGTLDAFADRAFVKAVENTRRRNLIIAGITTDVCLFHTTMSALKARYSVWIAADACGTSTSLGDQVTYERLRAAGAVITTTLGTLFELYPDLSTAEGKRAEAIATADVKMAA
ncbi:MAG: isochorismatase family protein [Phycisphaerales bacterium]|nr:isochorismatase family protein [Hyphomonadaceae bacterium]